MSKRRIKTTDQANIQRGYELVNSLIEEHPEIESSLWVGIFLSSIATSFIESELEYEDFREELESAIDHYEDWWEDSE